MKNFLLAVILVFSLGQINAQKPILFPAEYIDFKIDSNYFSINGIYTFKNNTDTSVFTEIFFPFAADMSFIDCIQVVNLTSLKPVTYRKRKKGISFHLQLGPNGNVDLNISYRQPLARKNSYILTTTKLWGRPLEKAVYNLTADKNLKIVSFSLKPDSSNVGLVHSTYYWNKQNFTPPADFEVIIDR
jgi:hypothetical protein